MLGEQATGKTLFLELVKFIYDKGYIGKILAEKGFTMDSQKDILALYFGCHPDAIPVHSETKVVRNGKDINIFTRRGKHNNQEKVFYMPAQRVLTLADGWFKDFNSFGLDTPFVVRHFSETMRHLIERIIRAQQKEHTLFPHKKRLKAQLKNKLQKTIFKGWNLSYREEGMRKHLVLSYPSHENAFLSFFSWSTGQREFIPLLLGFYWLMPSAKKSKRPYNFVIIEEPEMGLHPHAYHDVLLLILTLVERGYKVLVSTHSPATLDVVWVLRNLFNIGDDRKKEQLFCEFFDLDKRPWVSKLVNELQKKSFSFTIFIPKKMAQHR